jgi:hypothetical protein
VRLATSTRAAHKDKTFALPLLEDPTVPLQSLEIEQALALMTMASLRHPYHTVDTLSRTTGLYCLPEELIHTPIGALPLRCVWTRTGAQRRPHNTNTK